MMSPGRTDCTSIVSRLQNVPARGPQRVAASAPRLTHCRLIMLLAAVVTIWHATASAPLLASPPIPGNGSGSIDGSSAGTANGGGGGESVFSAVFTGDFATNPFRIFVDGAHRLDILNHPGPLIDTLSQLHVVWAGIFVVCGVLTVFFGFRWHRWIVLLTAFITGMAIGTSLTTAVDTELIVAVCVGVLAAVVAWPAMKYAVTLCGALVGAFVGAHAWAFLNQPPETYWAGATTGFIAFGLLSFLIHRTIIVTMTCVAGAFVLIMGLITLLVQVEPWQITLRETFDGNTLLIPLFVLTASVIGIVAQLGETKAAVPAAGGGAPRPAGSPGGGGGGGGAAPVRR